MCRFLDIIKTGYLDNKTQRKRNRISLILMVLSLIIYIGVNSTVNSINSSIHDIMYAPEARALVTFFVPEYDGVDGKTFEEYKREMTEYFKGDERVKDVYFFMEDTLVEWCNVKEVFGEEKVSVTINSFCEPMLEFSDDKDLSEPKYNEVIIPKYIYDIGAYDKYTCFDGDELIGENITIKYTDSYGEGTKEYNLKVIGTYDNIRARYSGCHLLLNEDLTKEICEYEYSIAKKNEQAIKQELEDMGISPDSYEEVLIYRLGLYISEDYDMGDMLDYMMAEFGVAGVTYVSLDDNLQSYFGYIINIANVVSFMLLIIALINIVISSINEVKDRKWEFALKMSMGYKRSDIVKIFFVEKFVNMLKALLISLVLVAIYGMAATYVYQELMEYWKKVYVISVDWGIFAIAFLLVSIAAFIGVLVARISINSINVAESLKSGE